jgi:hypothetical protein
LYEAFGILKYSHSSLGASPWYTPQLWGVYFFINI